MTPAVGQSTQSVTYSNAPSRPRAAASTLSATADRQVEFTPPEIAATSALSEIVPRGRSEILNRSFNIALASAAILLLLPVMVIVAILIRLTSTGPILYVQTRIGLDRRRPSLASPGWHDHRKRDLGGRAFAIYKFRSMYTDAESRSGAVWASKSDTRVTPFGRIMRKCRLDELPQLINVLKGDMNIVGPRPERPSIFARLRDGIPEYPARQWAKPGITGWAQVNQAYDACMDDVRRKVRYDIEYLERQGVVEDVRIMAKTLPVVLFRWTGF